MATLPPPPDLNALPPVLDLRQAARLLGIGRTTAYKLAREGTFPVPLIRIGASYKVPAAPLRALLTNPSPTPVRRTTRSR
jgi:excisionase family DNA binding protein